MICIPNFCLTGLVTIFLLSGCQPCLQPLSQTPELETLRAEWEADIQADPNAACDAVMGQCDNGSLVFLRRSMPAFGQTGAGAEFATLRTETYYFDAQTSGFVGYVTDPGGGIGQCNGKVYWPELMEFADATTTESLCPAQDLGDCAPPDAGMLAGVDYDTLLAAWRAEAQRHPCGPEDGIGAGQNASLNLLVLRRFSRTPWENGLVFETWYFDATTKMPVHVMVGEPSAYEPTAAPPCYGIYYWPARFAEYEWVGTEDLCAPPNEEPAGPGRRTRLPDTPPAGPCTTRTTPRMAASCLRAIGTARPSGACRPVAGRPRR